MKTRYNSYLIGKLPKGCAQCVKGEKLVLFVTGLCPRKCGFCPISDDKHEKDVVYADEWKTDRVKDIIKEAELIGAKGAGITGGDPLCRLDRTIKYIKALKKRFGKFHVHLYSSLDLVSIGKLEMLNNSGLDEIRFHLDLDDDSLWPRLLLAKGFNWDVGVEIPVIPGKRKQIKRVVNFISGKGVFLNLNELQIPDNEFHSVKLRTKDMLSYAAKGSEELALDLLPYCKKMKVNCHYCTAKLKDKHQLANRLRRRADNVAKWYDEVDSEGMLTRGVIYHPKLKPGFGYRTKLQRRYPEIERELKKLKIKGEYDSLKQRLLTSVENIVKYESKLKEKGFIPAIVKEYPTHDQLEIEVEFI